MKRPLSPRSARRRTFLFLALLGPVLIGCEAILDFDRGPLQPVPDAGLEDSSSSTPGTDSGKKKDTGPAGDDDDDDKPDAKADSGKDAGDAGDGGDGGQQ